MLPSEYEQGLPIAYRHISLYCTSQVMFFFKLKVCGNPGWSKSNDAVSLTLLTVGHSATFGTSQDISDLFTIITSLPWSEISDPC